ncbi:MAG: GTPase HflX [Anaeroplasmataceae bacterium]
MINAIVVKAYIDEPEHYITYLLDELKSLCKTLDIKTIHTVTQKLPKINPSFYIGKGKIEYLKEIVEQTKCDCVIFDDELSPTQLRNIEKYIDCSIMDRSLLILDIFAQRAQTSEAKLDIKLARSKYLLPRIQFLNNNFSRQGGSSGSTSSKGVGEKQIDLDKRIILSDINKYTKELAKIHSMKLNQINRRKRNQIPTVTLVGYTNAGKSTTFNTLSDFGAPKKNTHVLSEDKLFATVGTTTRKIKHKNKEFLLTDSVGLVSNLPHHLISSFRSTLSEVSNSDLQIIVCDVSSKYFQEQLTTTYEVLMDLDALNNPIHLLNKVDNLNEDEAIQDSLVDPIFISFSNKTKLNVELVLDKIVEILFDDTLFEKEYIIPYTDAVQMNILERETEVLLRVYYDLTAYYKVKLTKDVISKLSMYELNSVIS